MSNWPKREQVDPTELLAAADVLRLAGWKTRRSISDAERKRDFPPPVVIVAGARLWHRQDVKRWIEQHPRST